MKTKTMIQVLPAVLLSLFFPGAGQFYNRQYVKGVLFIVAYTVGLILLLLTLGFIPYVATVIWLLSLIDAGWVARRKFKSGEDIPGNKMNRFIVILLGTALASSAYVLTWGVYRSVFFPSKQVLKDVEQRALNYLQDKYKEEFIVEGSSQIWATKEYIVRVHPKARTWLSFDVTEDFNRTMKDDYAGVHLADSLNKVMVPIANDIYADQAVMRIRVFTNGELRGPMSGKSITDHDVAQKVLGSHLYIYVFRDLTETNRDSDRADMINLVKHWQELNRDIKKASVRVTYFPQALFEPTLSDKLAGDEFYHFESKHADQVTKYVNIDDVRQFKP